MEGVGHAASKPVAVERERGVALLVSVLMVALMGMVGLAALDTVMRDRQFAGYQARARTALYAAEAGLATVVGMIRQEPVTPSGGGNAGAANWNANFPDESNPQTLGDAWNPPTFYGDPNAPETIEFLGPSGSCWLDSAGGLMSQNLGGVQWRDALWLVRVAGAAPGGTRASIEATVSSCRAFN